MPQRDPLLRLVTVSFLVLLIGGWVTFFSENKPSITRRQETFAWKKGLAERGHAVPGNATKECTSQKVPVLMYHHIRRCPEGSACGGKGSVEYGLSVDPALFERQMATLGEKGYRSILPRELAAGKVPCKAFVLTFDDGYDDNMTVLPVLKRYGFQAGFAIIIDRVDRGGYMGGADIEALKAAGHEILSHSVSHQNLTLLSDMELQKELQHSKAALQNAFRTPVQGVVYPSGKYDERVERAAQRAGYHMAFTTMGGWATLDKDPYAIRRVRMSNTINADLSEVIR